MSKKRRCTWVNARGVQCGYPEGHAFSHGNGTLTNSRDEWHDPNAKPTAFVSGFVAEASDNGDWRVGNKVRTNVYAGDRPICQCHTEFDAALIASAVNGVRHNITEQATDKRVSQLVNELKAARTAYHVRFGVPVSWEYARFLTAIGALEDLVAKGKL